MTINALREGILLTDLLNIKYDSAKIDTQFIETNEIDEIIISMQDIKSSRLLEIVEKISKLPIKVKIVPPIKTWTDGDLSPTQI